MGAAGTTTAALAFGGQQAEFPTNYSDTAATEEWTNPGTITKTLTT